jgi:citronellol/citronellal dehydrogenase
VLLGDVNGKVAVVTGASRGLGAAIGGRLAAAGAHVALAARTMEPDPKYVGSLSETIAEITGRGHVAKAFQADISVDEDRQRLIAEVEATMGPIDILVNNAALTYLLPIETFPEKRYRKMMDIQVWAPLELSKLVLHGMIERKEGWIVNISSRAGVNPVGPPFEEYSTDGGFSVYGLCKAALERLTVGMAAEMYKHNIAVNALSPWLVVATSGASAHNLVKDDTEGPELIAEAALALSSCPARVTGRIAYSAQLCAEWDLSPVVL